MIYFISVIIFLSLAWVSVIQAIPCSDAAQHIFWEQQYDERQEQIHAPCQEPCEKQT